MCCCACCVIVPGPSPATGVARRTRAVFSVAHPQVPCNRWRARQGDESAGNCPEAAPQRANACPIVAPSTSRSTSRRRNLEYLRCPPRTSRCLAYHEARHQQTRGASYPSSSATTAVDCPRICLKGPPIRACRNQTPA